MESDDVEGAAAAPMDTVTVATTPSIKSLNKVAGGLGLEQQTNDDLVPKVIRFAKSHCSGPTYDMTTLTSHLQKHLGDDIFSRPKYHIVGLLREAESEVSAACVRPAYLAHILGGFGVLAGFSAGT